MKYEIRNANTKERNIIDTIMTYIEINFVDKYNFDELKCIEVVDSLSGGSSARTIRNKILVARENGLDLVQQPSIAFDDICKIKEISMIFSTFYHELWHVNTWKKYSEMYEYIIKERVEDIYEAMAYLYWIEYIAHVDTVKMEDTNIMNTFCRNFVITEWHKMYGGYQDYIKALPYFLVRSHYLDKFEDLTNMIRCKELKDATYEFDLLSKQLMADCRVEEIEKAREIKKRIIILFE